MRRDKARRCEDGARSYWTIGPSTGRPTRKGLAHLLPIYDEYLIAYRDREAVPLRRLTAVEERAVAVNAERFLSVRLELTSTESPAALVG
ncbi:MAG TPA: hypothetical protein VM818_05440 [Vicinamibacterales bacterium]|nr:hypothetical protein [Vicinamibacterales bacterium]